MNWLEAAGLALLLAMAIDLVFGDPPNRYHPVAWMGSYIRVWGSRIPKAGESRRFLFGLMLLISGMIIFSVPLWGLSTLISGHPSIQIIITAVLLKPVFSLGGLLESGKAAADALQRGDLSEGRRLTSFHLVSRPTSDLDEGYVSSAVVESLAENVSDSIVAPLLAFTLGGLPGAWAYRFVNTADAMIGYHTAPYEFFGKSTAICDDVLNYIPSRLSGIMICLAAMITREDWRGAWRIMVRDHALTASPNAGWPMSAAAGALRVRLEKRAHYTLNPGLELPCAKDIARARRLVLVSALLWAAVSATILILI